MEEAFSNSAPGSFGQALKHWRASRRLSQLELAVEAGISARHLSFLETGRSMPSRQMVLLLANVLNVPLRDRNSILQAAGYAPVYRETELDKPDMEQARQALRLILEGLNPFAGIVVNRHWDFLMVNEGFLALAEALTGQTQSAVPPLTVLPLPRPNAIRMMFDPAGWRSYIRNWETVARSVIERTHREFIETQDPILKDVLDEVLSLPGVPEKWRQPDLNTVQDVLLPVEIKSGHHDLSFFTTIATLGSAQDITLQELRIESFHPMNEETSRVVKALFDQRRSKQNQSP